MTMFKNSQAYTVTEIADVLNRSANYVSKAFSSNKITPQGELVTERGPNAAIWRGDRLNELIRDGVIRKSANPGDIIWY